MAKNLNKATVLNQARFSVSNQLSKPGYRQRGLDAYTCSLKNPATALAERAQEMIDRALKIQPVASLGTDGRPVQQLSGVDKERFEARCLLRNYSSKIYTLRSFKRSRTLSKAQCEVIRKIVDSYKARTAALTT